MTYTIVTLQLTGAFKHFAYLYIIFSLVITHDYIIRWIRHFGNNANNAQIVSNLVSFDILCCCICKFLTPLCLVHFVVLFSIIETPAGVIDFLIPLKQHI